MVAVQIKPKLPVMKIELVEVERSLYRLIRSVVESSEKSIRCYEIGSSWWCEKYFALRSDKWVLTPCALQTTVGGEIAELPAVCVTYGRHSITVLHPVERLTAKIVIRIDGQNFTEEQVKKTAVTADVPWVYPIRLADILERIEELVEW